VSLRAGAVDLHTHVIPALDDGPADLETAVALARAAAADGTGVLVATSHSDEVLQQRLDRGAMEQRADEVRRAVAGAAIPLTILVGVEIKLEPDTVGRLRRGELYPLNDSRYVLVEPPFSALPPYVDHALLELQAAGYVPVIAHPERNARVQEEPRRLYDWVVRGAMVQISAASVTGGHGRGAARIARLAVAHRLAHVLASDAHDPLRRPPRLRPARDVVAQWAGPDVAQALVDRHPRTIVEDGQLSLEAALPLEAEGDGGLLRRLFDRS
jgi:protein-tyrosine phosphatase